MDFFSPAQIVGYIALVLGISSFLQKKDRNLKIFNALQCVSYAVHFSLLGNFTAVGSSGISAIRSVLAIYYPRKWLFWVFFWLNILIGLTIARAPQDWLPVFGCLLGTYALFYLKGVRMRLCFLASTVMWITNNILSGSIGGTMLECLIFLTNGSNIIRMSLETFARSPLAMTGGTAARQTQTADQERPCHFRFARRIYLRRQARMKRKNSSLSRHP